MSKHREEFEVHLPLKDCFMACREAVAAVSWRMLQQEENRLVCKEVAPQGTSFTWSAQVEILLTATESPERTKVTLKGSIFGFGPTQSGHLKGQVGNLRNRIEIASAKSALSPVSQGRISLVSELERLAKLHDEGALSDEEYHKAKAQLLSRES